MDRQDEQDMRDDDMRAPHATPRASHDRGSPALSLAHLLDQVRDDNLHAEVDSGSAVGEEAW